MLSDTDIDIQIIEGKNKKGMVSTINLSAALGAFASLIPSEGIALFSDGSENQPRAERVKPANTIGRNQPCPCGSGKKYKKCCLQTKD